MQMGMIGLGRMGASMVRRLLRGGHECVVYDVNADAIDQLAKDGAVAARSLDEFSAKLKQPRVAWMMVPAAIVQQTVNDLSQRFERGDTIVDGSNSHYADDIHRAKALAARGIHYVDSGTSGGVWGLERGFCQMIGGERDIVRHLDPIFATLAPAADSAAPKSQRDRHATATAEHGYLHCGPSGAGRFVKMVHNGIECGLMAAYAEGLNILRHANVGKRDARRGCGDDTASRAGDVQMRLQSRGHHRGLASRQRDRVVAARSDGECSRWRSSSGTFRAVSDSGEGRWTIDAAIDEGVPAPCSVPRCTRDSARAGRPALPTRFCPRCGISSAVTRKR
jgi:6-phosphogluconate dehydrogenase